MRAPKLCIMITAMALLFAACNKNKVAPIKADIFSGTYTGKFIYGNTDPSANFVPLTGNPTVVFSGKGYTATSSLPPFASSAKGSFTNDDKQATFADSTIHPANFDWGLILNGTYTYTTKGDSLFLIKKASFSTYTYKLLKVSAN